MGGTICQSTICFHFKSYANNVTLFGVIYDWLKNVSSRIISIMLDSPERLEKSLCRLQFFQFLQRAAMLALQALY